jgi:Fe2+ transport system protein FeoA
VAFGHTSNVKAENDNRFHLDELPVAKPLSLVPLSSTFRIDHLGGPVQDCNRLLDLGITPGEDVIVTHTAPLGDPLVIRIRGASLALRKREASWIWVV